MKKTAIAQKSAAAKSSRPLVVALALALICPQILSASDIINKVRPSKHFATTSEAKEAITAGRVPAEFLERGEGYCIAKYCDTPTVFIIRMDGDSPYVMPLAPEAGIAQSSLIFGKKQVAARKAAVATQTPAEQEPRMSREERLAYLEAINALRFNLERIGVSSD